MKIIIFGAGKHAKDLLQNPLRDNVEVLFVCDNNPDLWEKQIASFQIKSPEEICHIKYDNVIVAIKKWEIIKEVIIQLDDLGVPREKRVFVPHIDLLRLENDPVDMFFEFDKRSEFKRGYEEYQLSNIDIVPFRREPAIVYKHYIGETSRCHDRREKEGFFDLYCRGEGLDIGYGSDPVTSNVYGWDMNNGDAQYLEGIEDNSLDYVYASHCLEHMQDVRVALSNWFRVVREGGYLIIAVPHRDLYEKRLRLPSRWNADHKHMFLIGEKDNYDTLDIVEEVRESMSNYYIIYVKMCDYGHTINDPMIHSDGEYQIEMVIQKRATECENG